MCRPTPPPWPLQPPGTPLAPLAVSHRDEFGCRPASIGATPLSSRSAACCSPKDAWIVEAAPRRETGRRPRAADLIVHPLRPSRATALPDGGEAEVSPPGGDRNRRRTG